MSLTLSPEKNKTESKEYEEKKSKEARVSSWRKVPTLQVKRKEGKEGKCNHEGRKRKFGKEKRRENQTHIRFIASIAKPFKSLHEKTLERVRRRAEAEAEREVGDNNVMVLATMTRSKDLTQTTGSPRSQVNRGLRVEAGPPSSQVNRVLKGHNEGRSQKGIGSTKSCRKKLSRIMEMHSTGEKIKMQKEHQC